VIIHRITPIKVQQISSISTHNIGFRLQISIRDFQLPDKSQKIKTNSLIKLIAEIEITPATGNKIAARRAATKKNELKQGFSFAKKNLLILQNCIEIFG
jgi:hypothetical protein